MNANLIVVVPPILCLSLLVPVACNSMNNQNEITETISENCKMTGEFGVLTSGHSFAMYDCKEEADQ